MTEERPVLILVGDSRICGFDSLEYPDVKFESIIKRGAVIDDLREETLELIEKYKNVDRTIIVKIACGINEFTKFKEGENYRDLRYRSGVSNTEVLGKLKSLKQDIKTVRPGTIVGFVTVPTLSFRKYRDYRNKSKRHAKKSKVGDSDLYRDQEKLDNKLALLNASLKFENSRHQVGVSKGCFTVSWHNTVTKRSTRKRRSGSRVVIRNNFDKLYDGLHANRELKSKWHNQLVKCVNAEVKLVKRP